GGQGLVHRFVDGVGGRGVKEVVEIALDAAFGGQNGANFLVQAETKDVEGFQVEGIADGDLEFAVFLREGKDQVLFHQLVGDQRDGIGGHGAFVEVDELHVVLGREGLVDVAFGGEL